MKKKTIQCNSPTILIGDLLLPAKFDHSVKKLYVPSFLLKGVIWAFPAGHALRP